VIDPYDSWPPSTGEGLFLSGWQYRNRVAALERWSVPKGAHRKLSRRFGAPPLLEDTYGAQPARRLLAARRDLLAAPARVSALVTDLLAREPFELVWATFSAGHFAGHFLWDTSGIVDGDAVAPAEEAALARTVEDVYEAVDRAIGEILGALDDQADVIVVSPIGMGPFTSRSDMLPEQPCRRLFAPQSPELSPRAPSTNWPRAFTCGVSTGRGRVRSRFRESTTATSGSTSAAASATESSIRARPTSCATGSPKGS
jgi:hypothetical protein